MPDPISPPKPDYIAAQVRATYVAQKAADLTAALAVAQVYQNDFAATQVEGALASVESWLNDVRAALGKPALVEAVDIEITHEPDDRLTALREAALPLIVRYDEVRFQDAGSPSLKCFVDTAHLAALAEAVEMGPSASANSDPFSGTIGADSVSALTGEPVTVQRPDRPEESLTVPLFPAFKANLAFLASQWPGQDSPEIIRRCVSAIASQAGMDDVHSASDGAA